MSELYHAAQLPLDFSDTPRPKRSPYGSMSDRNNIPTEVRTCKKCGRDLHPKWETTRKLPSGGRWLYPCYACKHKRQNGNEWKKKYDERRKNERAQLKAESPELYKELNRRRRGHSNHRKSATERQRKLGVTRQQYLAMFAEQNGLCSICGQPETRKVNGKTISLALDHDHATGQVRALLCTRCNVALGCVNDDVTRLQTMIDYLEFHKRNAES